MLSQKIPSHEATNTTKLLAAKDRKIAELEAALKLQQTAMEDLEQDAADTIATLGKAIEQAVVLTAIHVHAQRRINSGLIALAEQFSKWCETEVSLPALVVDIQATKHVVQCLADNDQTPDINHVLEQLCKIVHLHAHHVAQQIIHEVDERAESMQEVANTFSKRLEIGCRQREAIIDATDMSEEEKACRIANLAEDVAAQLKVNPAFDFEAKIVPHGDGVPKQETVALDLSVAKAVRRKLLGEK
ncbi:hypothetical protein N0V94_000274 [Neodidymelliopsis sp. IMI 364377]|nr:hypothetical protein N0V94_000274 [Neodidymelliopsis sp. IMI 364377]